LRALTYQMLIDSMPIANRLVYEYILHFLHEVTQHSEKNMMNSKNLSIVWGPTLMRSDEEDHILLATSNNLYSTIVKGILDRYNEFYLVSSNSSI
jgi:hypothetical protein